MGLDNKVKELIAVGASVTANCQPCLQYHAAKALEFGADPEEVATAIEVGKVVRKGASAKMDGFAASLKDVPPTPAGTKPPVCCG
ncbi:MAG: carboxymuconolactone decarboxylase family protein [Deltaproteobacteria bacterium]|nr:carboxymuconolactone decarboxylase family protein [Deltaproteobacteria bacterium]